MTYASARGTLTAAGRAPKSDLADQINANFDVLKGIEDDYTDGSGSVSISSGGSLGNGSLQNHYRRIKGRVHGYGRFTLGSTSTVTAPLQLVGLHPSGPADAQFTPMTVAIHDFDVNRFHIGVGQIDETGFAIINFNGVSNMSTTVPFTWAIGDSIRWSFEARAGEIQTTLR